VVLPSSFFVLKYRGGIGLLALIRYSIEGVEPQYGLRLDLGKQVFIDYLEDEETDGFLQKVAPKIVEFLSSIMYPTTDKNGRSRIIDLNDSIPGDASIQFLRAEIPGGYWTPFALIRYSIEGVEPQYGLRLDLGKQVFIDHLEDEEKDGFLQKVAPKILKFLGPILSPKKVQN